MLICEPPPSLGNRGDDKRCLGISSTETTDSDSSNAEEEEEEPHNHLATTPDDRGVSLRSEYSSRRLSLLPRLQSARDLDHDSDDVSRASCISFGDVTVHTHSVTLGDNPSVTEGPPLALDAHVDSMSCCLDDFEMRKTRRTSSRRKAARIPVEQREALLKELGHKEESLKEISREIQTIKASRMQARKAEKSKKDLDVYWVLSQVSLRETKLKARHAEKDRRATNQPPRAVGHSQSRRGRFAWGRRRKPRGESSSRKTTGFFSRWRKNFAT